MRKVMGVWFIAVAMVLWCGLTPLRAQEETKQASEDKAQPELRTGLPGIPGTPGNRPVHPYRVDFIINELEGEKKINARHYSMILTSGDRNQIKIGTRVPVVTETFPNKPEATQFQYMDVGTSINCGLEERCDELVLEVHGESSNFSSSTNEQHSSQPMERSQPIIRQINISGSTLAGLGKAVVIGAVDDPNSNRTFQLEAMVTKLKEDAGGADPDAV